MFEFSVKLYLATTKSSLNTILLINIAISFQISIEALPTSIEFFKRNNETSEYLLAGKKIRGYTTLKRAPYGGIDFERSDRDKVASQIPIFFFFSFYILPTRQ